MYFNNNKEDTNIDSEFENKKILDFNKFKIPLIIIGIILLIIIIIVISSNKKEYYINLNGLNEMTIYQGSDYEEPGYSGYDNKKNDLTKKVVVNGKVDSSTTGTYIITYSLNKTKVTRTINVIEKTISSTYMHLKGDINMYLKVGGKYVEPGYVAIDPIDGNITDKVTIKSNVDMTKKGVYKIVYTIVNSNGKKTETTRTIVVE